VRVGRFRLGATAFLIMHRHLASGFEIEGAAVISSVVGGGFSHVLP